MKSSTATILSILVLIGCIITLLGFTYADKVEKRITSINISIIDDVDSKFLTVPRVRTHLDSYGKIIGELETDLQLEAMHSHLTNIPSVLNVKIFSNLNGELIIELTQRKAQARVHIDKSSDYYIDELGESMPLDPNYSERVPIIHAKNIEEVSQAISFIKEIENDELGVALKTASEDLREKILGNMSSRAAEMIREDMEFMGPVRLSDVEAAQQRIVDIVRRLEDAGDIVITGRGGSQDVVV